MSKKLYFILGLVMVASLVLASCGPTAPEVTEEQPVVEDKPEPEVVEGPGEITFDMPAPVGGPGEVGGWLDGVAFSVVSSDAAVTQLEAGAIDLFGSALATPQDLQAIQDGGFNMSQSFGLYYELTFNPYGPEFDTGVLNPFSNTDIREAMNWIVDRDYINQEVYGGISKLKFFPLTAGFPDYAKYIQYIRPLEAAYAYDFERAETVITAAMEEMGAVMADGVWTYNGEVVELIFLIRTDSDGTRRPIGDYVATQLESIGFVVDRQYKTSSEASPLWIGSNPSEGLWHFYTGAWGTGSINRDQGSNWQFFYSPKSVYGSVPLWQAYTVPEDMDLVFEALANNEFSTIEEREALFAQALPAGLQLNYRVWLIDGVGFAPWSQSVSVSYDLAGGVNIHALWPHTMQFVGQNGGLLTWGTPDLFVDPANPFGGSNWTYDSQWQIATQDYDYMPNPHTGVYLPHRLERAEVTVVEGLPVTATYDWVDLQFAAEITVPADAWLDWDAEAQDWITVGEAFPDGLTANRKAVVYYEEDMLSKLYWHDGAPFQVEDLLLPWILQFAEGTEGDPLYDEGFAPSLESFKATFKGYKLVSADPIVIEYYSDTWFLDAEYNVPLLWANNFGGPLGYGTASWGMLAVSNLAEAAGELAYSSDKADALEVEWMNYIGGPSLEILEGYAQQAMDEGHIPFPNVLGEYIDTEEAQVRYARILSWYEDKGHFWIGTGPYMLDEVFQVEKTATMVHNPFYPDPSDRWTRFATPKLAEVEVDGPAFVTIGEEALFDVYITFQGEDYPIDELLSVKYLLYDAGGELVEYGEATAEADGWYSVTLSAESTAALEAGANKLEIAVAAIPVSVPSFGEYEFVTE
ncbi:ABC transporter substrate-binding protein [Chloroflexota bacterium]